MQGHAPHEKQTVPGKRRVRIAEVEHGGQLAVRIVFDDGHQTGIYTWPYLWSLGAGAGEKLGAYLVALKAQGLSRG